MIIVSAHLVVVDCIYCVYVKSSLALQNLLMHICFFFFQAEDGIRDLTVTGVQTCALPIYGRDRRDRAPLPDLPPRRRAAGGEPAHRGDPAHGGRARGGRRPPEEGRRRDALLHRGEEARGGGRRDLP